MNQRVYEQLMNDISILVNNALNEAYENALLEKYEFKSFLDKAIEISYKMVDKNAKQQDITKAQEATYRNYIIAKKFIVKTILIILLSKGTKAAIQYANTLKNNIVEYIKLNKKISPKELFNISKKTAFALGMLTMFGINSIILQTKEEVQNLNADNIELQIAPVEISDLNIDVDTAHDLLTSVPQDFGKTPYQYFKETGAEMTPTEHCKSYIKSEECLCLYPYFATQRELRLGKITIGYGHVICDNWKDPKSAWYFPTYLTKDLKLRLKQLIIKYAKANLILVSSVKLDANGQFYNANIHKNLKPLLTKADAEKFIESDLKEADRKLKITLGIKKSSSPKFQENLNINNDVKFYCYYNQNIYDAFISCIFNSGALNPSNSLVVANLLKCGYDYKNNRVNVGDFNVTMASFKKGNGNNLKRRTEEYYTFINKKNTLDHFNKIID